MRLGFAFGKILTSVALVYLVGCASPTKPSDNAPPSASTVWWEPDNLGYTQFYTNDVSLVGASGTTELYPYSPSETQSSARTLQVKLKKVSGDPTMGFGVIFSYQDVNNYMFVVIDTTGYYQVGQVISGSYYAIRSWTDGSPTLFSGYSVINSVAVTFDPTKQNNPYSLAFNGTAVMSFSDQNTAALASTVTCETGFLVGISSTESFPSAPVDVRFQRVTP